VRQDFNICERLGRKVILKIGNWNAKQKLYKRNNMRIHFAEKESKHHGMKCSKLLFAFSVCNVSEYRTGLSFRFASFIYKVCRGIGHSHQVKWIKKIFFREL
jgi:hypothetical protein